MFEGDYKKAIRYNTGIANTLGTALARESKSELMNLANELHDAGQLLGGPGGEIMESLCDMVTALALKRPADIHYGT